MAKREHDDGTQKQRQVRFDDETWDDARTLAEQDDRSIAALLRWLVKEEKKRRERRKL